MKVSFFQNCVAGKNEVSLEFHQNDDALVNLSEIRFHIPANELAGDVDPVEAFRYSYLADNNFDFGPVPESIFKDSLDAVADSDSYLGFVQCVSASESGHKTYRAIQRVCNFIVGALL